MTQADLFGPEALPTPRPEVVELAQRIPSNIRFGTSTWTYDGWFGDVFHRHYRGPQPALRLEEYARCSRTVYSVRTVACFGITPGASCSSSSLCAAKTCPIPCNGPISWTIFWVSCLATFVMPWSSAIRSS